MGDIAIASSGSASAALTQNRRVMSSSSGFGASPSVTVLGSRAIPQIGQLPAPGRTISGCIGQVQVAPAGTSGAEGAAVRAVGEGKVFPTKAAGSASSRARRFALQKAYVSPSRSMLPPFAAAGSTNIPQTGSRTRALMASWW
jgi:hypothetical protein